MVTEAALVPLRDVLATQEELPVYLVPQAVMNGITGFNLHRGCLRSENVRDLVDWREVIAGARRTSRSSGSAMPTTSGRCSEAPPPLA